MDTFINNIHDEEIIAISFIRNEKKMEITTSNYILYLKDVEYFEFSPFEIQNVIFDIKIYDINNTPKYILQDYEWINKYLNINYPDLQVFFICSSVGLEGAIILKSIESLKRNVF